MASWNERDFSRPLIPAPLKFYPQTRLKFLMKINIKKTFSDFFESLILEVQFFFLILKNRIQKKQLRVNSVLFPEKVVFLESLSPVSMMPVASETKHFKGNFASEFGRAELECPLNRIALTIGSEEIRWDYDSFEQKKYEHSTP